MKILNNVSIDNTLTLEELNAARVSLSGVPGIGELSWNDVDGTADLTLKGGSVVLQIGQEFHSRVYNAESFPLVPGNVVYAYGAVGGQTSVKLANASSEVTSRNTVGVITEVIPAFEEGFVTILGKVRNLDTSAYTANQTLYLSAVDGQLTATKPQSPNFVVAIGWVSEVSATTGSIRLNVHAVPNSDEISYDNSDSGLVATNVKSGLDELQLRKADISLLSSNITLYTTNAASDIGGYYKLVSEVSDPSYNTTPVNITSGPITTTNQLINSFIASPNLFIGNPGFINISTIGNIRKTSGNQTQYAEFFFRVYKRSSAGVETLIATSNTTGLIQNTNYVEFNATAILNNGTFVDTDRVVIKHFANILSGSRPVYDLEFGGSTPTRTLFPVPVSVIPAGTASSVIVDTSSFNGILSGSNSTIQSALNTIDSHNHDNRYYTETEINTMLDGLSSAAVDISISDIGNYYTGTNVETALQEIGVALTNVSGDAIDISITDTNNYFTSTHVEGALQEVGANLLAKANSTHNHIIGDVNGLQLALDAKAPLASPSLTGIPVAPTAAVGTNTTQLATTAFVNAEIANDAAAKVHSHVISDTTGLQTALDGKEPTFTKNTAFNKNFGNTVGTVTEGNDPRLSDARTPTAHTHDDRYYTETEIDTALALKAPLASPALTGIPTAPTATAGTNTTQLATTAFVQTGLATKANTSHTHIIADVTNLQTSLDAKAPLASPALTGVPTAPTAAVNTNTTQVATTAFVNAEIANDAAPKVHTHTTSDVTNLGTTLGSYQLRSEKGQSNGYASLGADGKVPSSELPSFVDDVLEYANLAGLPVTGETGKIYVTLDTNKTYRWSGTAYVEISASLALGETSSTAYRGDYGKIAYDHSQTAHAPSNANYYVHPTGFVNVPTTALAGANVISQVTVNTNGHVTGVTSRALTPTDIGAQAAGSYAAATHNHAVADVTGLQTALDSKQATLTTGYGDTLNPYLSKTAKYFLAAPNAAAGVPSFRAIVASDIPTLNQNTTGSAATLTTARTLTIGSTGKTFNGSANVSWTLAEIGAQAAGSYAAAVHTHGTYDNSTALTGANVYSNVAITDGIVTGLTSRALTASDIGAAKKATNEATATDGQVLTANGDGTFTFETSASGMSIFSEEFTATEGQTNFTLTTGSYSPGSSRLTIYIWGLRQHNTAFTETSSTTFALAAGVPAGTKVLAEWRVADPTLKGDTGTAATVAVGTTTTGAAGTNASVTNSGNSSAAVFNFTIPRGNTGATGAAATIAVGTVTTLDPGSTATVTNVGTSGAAIFNFGIPKGATGDVNVSTTTTGEPSKLVSTDTSGNITAATTFKMGTAASIQYNSTTKSIDFIFA